MNWDAVGAISEAVGVVAVLVTLIYLAVQVRHTNMLTRIGTHRDVDESLSSFLGDLAKDKDLHEIWFKGTQGSEPLDEKERCVRVRPIVHGTGEDDCVGPPLVRPSPPEL